MKPEEFIRALAPSAQASAAQTKIPASFTVATAALESAWGESLLTREACNLFGIKADKSWTGSVLAMPTKEFENGQPVTTSAYWRKYPTWLESVADHAAFLQHDRYKAAFKQSSPWEFAEAIRAAGYSTDQNYANKIRQIITQYGLAALDGPVLVTQKEQKVDTTPSKVGAVVQTGVVGGMSVPVYSFVSWFLATLFPNHPIPEDVKLSITAFILWAAHGLTGITRAYIASKQNKGLPSPLSPASD